jgi:hypothetical protein
MILFDTPGERGSTGPAAAPKQLLMRRRWGRLCAVQAGGGLLGRWAGELGCAAHWPSLPAALPAACIPRTPPTPPHPPLLPPQASSSGPAACWSSA